MHWFLLLWLGAAAFLAPRFTAVLIVLTPVAIGLWFLSGGMNQPAPAASDPCAHIPRKGPSDTPDADAWLRRLGPAECR